MLNWFRRQRLLAALLIAANPALVGSWVAAYHPCPVRDGAATGRTVAASHVAMSEHAGHEGMLMEEETAPPPSHDHSNSDGPCTCIGQCLTSGIALPSFAGDETRLSVAILEYSAPSTQHPLALPASVPLDLLPPSTAPPTA